MLKVYMETTRIIVDDKHYHLVSHREVALDTEPTEIVLLDNASFEEVCTYLSEHHPFTMRHIQTRRPLGRIKSEIHIEDMYSHNPVVYKHFDKLTYKTSYTEHKSVTLNWIMEHLSADQCIQYLKDRGMTACPIKED